ncbi:hypothetical protein Q3G72_017822 [Acer saccharum]|nr:hypothetical protein Q3G72_017822 [Acer saccharum]
MSMPCRLKANSDPTSSYVTAKVSLLRHRDRSAQFQQRQVQGNVVAKVSLPGHHDKEEKSYESISVDGTPTATGLEETRSKCRHHNVVGFPTVTIRLKTV